VRMSKSLGNHIAIHAAPEDMYGKVMSLPDTALPVFFRLVTRYTPEQVARVERDLAGGARNPRDVKMELAREIVTIFRGQERAAEAERAFVRVFQERQTPEDVPGREFTADTASSTAIFEAGLADSRSEARRLIKAGAVDVDGERLTEDKTLGAFGKFTLDYQVGKRRFVRFTIKSSSDTQT